MHWASTLIHVIIMYQQYVKCYRNKYLYIFQSLANTDQKSLCLPTIMTMQKNFGEYTQLSTHFSVRSSIGNFGTWSTLACSLYTQNVILCKFGNCINHGVEMLKKTALLLYKNSVCIARNKSDTFRNHENFEVQCKFFLYHLQLETTMNCHSVILS